MNRYALIAWCLCAVLVFPALVQDASGVDEEVALRDPFWPVGYTPPKRKDAPKAGLGEGALASSTSPLAFTEFSAEEAAMIRKHTNVDGIMKKGLGFYAVINSQIVRPGDILRIDLQHKNYRFLVRSITTERVTLDYIKEDEDREKGKNQKES